MSRTTMAAQEETRLALAAAAARAERQNQPKFLLYGAAALLLASIIFVGISFSASLAASSDLGTQRKLAEGTIQRAGEFKALKRTDQAEPKFNQPAGQIRTRIEQAGVDVGLKDRVPLPQTRTDPQRTIGSQQTRFDYEVRDEDLPRLLAWVQKSLAEVQGLEVYSVTLRPEAHKWKLNVSFSRWERIETQ
jgi:hypothetical protein